MSVPDFSQSDLLRQAQGNAMATLLGTLAYLKRGGGSLQEWSRFLGEQFAPSWSEAAGVGCDTTGTDVGAQFCLRWRNGAIA